jgi:hypothetical protein
MDLDQGAIFGVRLDCGRNRRRRIHNQDVPGVEMPVDPGEGLVLDGSGIAVGDHETDVVPPRPPSLGGHGGDVGVGEEKVEWLGEQCHDVRSKSLAR